MTLLWHHTSAFVLIITASLFLLSGEICSGQEPQQGQARWFELLTMNGGKPNLSATGEGITSYRTTELYQRGTTRVNPVKPAEARFKIELPIGYTVFNNLMYSLESDAQFTGPIDISFSLPSAQTRETFDQLRILYAQLDQADPEVPKWIDATLAEDNLADAKGSLSEAEIKQRLRNFETRTLHAFTDFEPGVLIVALRDAAKVRERFTADIEVTGTVTPQVIEGRSITYELKITNRGPDTANAISLHSPPSFTLVSATPSQGKCTMSAQNVYCKFPSLEKGRTIDVKIVERCEWRHESSDGPNPSTEGPSPGFKHITIGATEQDPSRENNELTLTTAVYRDPNKGPVVEVLSPTLFQSFPGPAASVLIRFKASDPDGFIKKTELFGYGIFTEEKSLGEATLRSDGEYELIYKDVPFGRQWVRIVVTDNLGRFEELKAPEFFVNGLAKVEIINPKPGSKLNEADGEFAVTIHAANPSSPLKKVSLDAWNSDATAIGNDNYVVKLKSCFRKCRLQAVAIDEKGIETRSDYVEFLMAQPPTARLKWFDGQYAHYFEDGKTFKVNELILAASADHEKVGNEATIAKLEIFANGVSVCTDRSPDLGFSGECVWKPSPGKYKLQVVATDSDGAVGKSELIEVTIDRP